MLAFQKSGEKDMRAYLEKQLGTAIVEKTLAPFQLTALGYRRDGKDA